jgi:hypothetical protein
MFFFLFKIPFYDSFNVPFFNFYFIRSTVHWPKSERYIAGSHTIINEMLLTL